MFVRNAWYVAAWDHEVPDDALFTRTLLGEPILLYRVADRRVVAMTNRCCHRHAPLSIGRKEGDCVRCMYHGLKYDQQGRCVEIPGQNAIPASLQLKTYPVVESGRWIFVWMGDPKKADRALLPDVSALRHPQWRMKPGYLHYQANYLVISDNLLDFSHLSFVHEGTLGGTGAIAEIRPKVERLARGVKITRQVNGTVPAPYHLQFAKFTGLVDRYWIYEYLVPGFLLMDSGVDSSDRADPAAISLRFRSCQALTPESEGTTHYFFMQGPCIFLGRRVCNRGAVSKRGERVPRGQADDRGATAAHRWRAGARDGDSPLRFGARSISPHRRRFNRGRGMTRGASAMPALLLLLVATTFSGSALSAEHRLDTKDASRACRALQRLVIPAAAIGLPTRGALVSSAQLVLAGDSILAGENINHREFCAIRGSIEPYEPAAPAIEFAVNLPTAWNFKALQYGGGGYDGTLVTGLGLASMQPPGSVPPLERGYATLGSDGGHEGKPGFDGTFGLNDEALLNYGRQSVKKTHDVAAVIMQRYYGQQIRRFYFIGASQGGHEALDAAARYPADYDGVVANYPAYNVTMLHLASVNVGESSLWERWCQLAERGKS